MSDYQLRQFEWRDIPAITAIYKHYVDNTAISFDLEAPSEAMMAEKFASILGLAHPLIVAETTGSVAGYAYASYFRPRLAYRYTCENSIYLHPDQKGRGLGRVLFTELLAQARSYGFQQMLAGITADNVDSIAFHEKFGFERAGYYKSVGYKFDRWHDIVHLQLAL